MLMPGPVRVEDYAVVLIWLAICSVYTTLLTVTALGVVYILRKRRSSILKSQRPPRTPFSELEFNVATPTDTAKSRRVSFSRRTGVAEFVTNEATTTWKNFYEEHNKSLESSGNESEVKPIGHIGKRIFDQQFEEVEAVDFISTLNNQHLHFNNSINNINFSEQLASLENTDDRKLAAPAQNFELSSFTDHQSKLFGDELSIPVMGEMSDRIDVNFSAVQQIGIKDDLDEIQNDLMKAKNNVVCPGPFADGREVSEYIEIDLNMTSAVARNDESDMSITDTVHSPKVQNLSKNNHSDRKSVNDKDWMVDKENIVVNPYIAPKESVNFAINDNPDEVLVFDGKRLTVQSEKDNRKEQDNEKNYRQIYFPDAPPEQTPQRKTIVLNVNDDLPNFVENTTLSKSHIMSASTSGVFKHSTLFDDKEPIQTNKIDAPEKRRTVVFDNSSGNLSVTQAVPSNIIPKTKENDKRRTIVYESETGNISITQAVPANIILSDNNIERRRTVYDDNISMTQAVPTNIMVNKNEDGSQRRRTVVYEEGGDISMTQALPTNIVPGKESSERRRTVVYEDCNVSMTQAIPAKILTSDKEAPERRKTIIYEDDGNISMTQAVPTNIILPEKNSERRRTVIFENDNGNVSVTQALPGGIFLPEIAKDTNKRRTIVYEEGADISMTQAVPNNVLLSNKEPERRRTVVYEDETGNISVTQALPSNIILAKSEKRRTIIYDNDGNMSITQALPANVILPQNNENKRRTIVYEDDDGNLSITQDLPKAPEKRKTIVFDSDSGDISMTQALPSNIVTALKGTGKRRTVVYEDDTADVTMTQTLPARIIEKPSEKRRTIVFDDNAGDISVTQAVPSNLILSNLQEASRKSIHENAQKPDQESKSSEIDTINKRRTIMFENDTSDKSTTEMVPNKVISQGSSEESIMAHKRKTIQESDIDTVSVEIKDTNYEIAEDKRKSNLATLNDLLDMSSESVNIMPDKMKTVDEKPSNKPTIKHMHDASMAAILSFSIDDVVNKTKTFVMEPENADISMKEDVPQLNLTQELEKRKTLAFEDFNKSISKPIPNDMLEMDHDIFSKSNIDKLLDVTQDAKSVSMHQKQDVLVYQTATVSATKLTKMTDQGDTETQNRIDSTSYTKENTSMKVDKENEPNDTVPNTEEVIDQNEDLDDEVLKQDEPKEEAMEIESNKASPSIKTVASDVEMPEAVDAPKKSILNDLLDMSNASMTSGIDDKNIMAKIESEQHSETQSQHSERKVDTETESNESLFYITKDSDDEVQTDKIEDQKDQVEDKPLKFTQLLPELEENSPLSLEYKAETDLKESEIVDDLQKKLSELKSVLKDDNKSPVNNRFYEKIVSSDLKDEEMDNDKSNVRDRLDISKAGKSFRLADDTHELLEMLSDFTDRRLSNQSDERKSLSPTLKAPKPIENKTETNEPRRLSFAPSRQSIVISREDLLNNISMAQAALQQSRFDTEDSVSVEDTATETPMVQSPPKKTVRVSNEVVKTLHFEDDTSEASIRSDTKISPLKKTAFGETSYMKETKAKVIPSYLKDVSDGIKELMHDLVKPMADVLPFETIGVDKGVKKCPSTCSTQIQANLITSSQIDLDTELQSNVESTYNMEKMSDLAADVASLGEKAVSQALKNLIKPVSTTASVKSSEVEVSKDFEHKENFRPKRQQVEPPVPERVIVFDHYNPLNNILLAPPIHMDVHKYNPTKSNDTLCGSERSQSVQLSFKEKEVEIERVSTQYIVESRLTVPHVQPSGDFEKADTQSILSNASKPISIDQSIDTKADVKDTEVNTLIAMKGNKELLDASSSLTLVDDALTQNAFDVDIDTNATSSKELAEKMSPVEVIYQPEGSPTKIEKVDSDFTSNDEEAENKLKGKKRIYSPAHREKYRNIQPNIEITPKPVNKIQKMSNSPLEAKYDKPNVIKIVKEEEKSEFSSSDSPKIEIKKRSPRKSKTKKPGTSLTVQRLVAEYHMEGIDQNALNKEILEALKGEMSDTSAEPHTASQSDPDSKSLDIVSSFTSSKNQNEAREVISCTTTDSRGASDGGKSQMDWQPDLINEFSASMIKECESSVNVVAKIDMLPFMGSHECEWESWGADTWSFRLLHGRLRLSVRLAHRHDNAARTRVRADTPVLAVEVDTVPLAGKLEEKKSTVASLCVNFAADTMRYIISRGWSCAGQTPRVLRRVCGVGRVALRWARAMHDARTHLAYTLTPDGRLALKVANIPLRSVWEVTMRLELVVEDARETPWPRAADVRVSRVVSDYKVTEDEVRRALAHLPADWGHVPRTIWKIFRYLKHKTRDDDLLLGI